MKTVISNDPAPIGERCFLCGEPLTPPWFKTGKFRMHTACRDLVREDFEVTHRRRLINPQTANANCRNAGAAEQRGTGQDAVTGKSSEATVTGSWKERQRACG